MKRILLILCTLFFFAGCSKVTTPAIEGTVIDKETKQPIENAWVLGMAEVKTYHPAGANANRYCLTKLHTRTGKDGRFFIAPLTTRGIGAEITKLRIDIYAPEGKRGAIDIDRAKGRVPYPVRQDEEAVIKPSVSLKEKQLNVVIPVRNVEMTIEQLEEDMSELGMYSRYAPKAENAYDNLEKDYIINEREKLLKRMENPKTVKEKVMYSNQLYSLAALHEQRGSYLKALVYYQKLYEFDKAAGFLRELDTYKKEIDRIKEKLKDN